MSDLYPLVLKPFFSERIWGTRDLSPIYSEVPGEQPIGEAWLTGDQCKVANGPLAGKTLGDLSSQFGRELVGETSPEPQRFPLLIKFLFPHDKLSVQVHPDDAHAQTLGQPWGKTECWYVLAAEPGAQVGLGLKPGTTREQLQRAINEVRAEQLLNWIDVHTGDMIYVDAGTVHAIGPGSILVETQQSSDTTFRLYDYGRARELHIDQGLAATRESTHAGRVVHNYDDGKNTLIATQRFLVEKFELRASSWNLSHSEKSAAQCIVPLRGSGVLECAGAQPISISPGQSVVIPAVIDEALIRPQWELEFLKCMVPAKKFAEPETRLVGTALSI
ncbi:MAG TPA: type I phosphomannose isomerase catalytic subunit [Terriglobales bacterium]|nr:type I phosphomannose isomerase catalytic subunit [Terriglobales bacterium]